MCEYCCESVTLTSVTLGSNGKIMIKESASCASVECPEAHVMYGNSNNYTGALSMSSVTICDIEPGAAETGVSVRGETVSSVLTVEFNHGTSINTGCVYSEGPGGLEGTCCGKGESSDHSVVNGGCVPALCED